MDRPEHKGANMFVGTEVEHTPAHGMRTLFVIGLQDPKNIVAAAQEFNCSHIYFGANMSFPRLDVNSPIWNDWEIMIGQTLMHGCLCTLDLDVSCAEGLLESSLIEHSRFIPMISVKLPYIRQFNYNTTIKLDDKDFKATNPGVWCHSLHELQKRECFTDWSKYTQDEVIK